MAARRRADLGPSASINVVDDVSAPCAALAQTCAGLKTALDEIGAPVIRRRPGGFEGLFRIIVEQQVSVPSAQAILARVDDGLDRRDPEAARAVGVDGLRAFGLSRPKAAYVVGLADAIVEGRFDPDGLARMDDEAALEALVGLKGVGPWTASIYLLFCEGRIDVWPPKDVALRGAYGAALAAAGSAQTAPNQAELDAAAVRWAPHRGLAAHVLWTYYAALKGRAPI